MGKKLEKFRQAVAQFFKTANPEDEFFWYSSMTPLTWLSPSRKAWRRSKTG
jgi:hypothetical protein